MALDFYFFYTINSAKHNSNYQKIVYILILYSNRKNDITANTKDDQI